MAYAYVYSVVTDLARFRGKSTSTPFMMARSTGQSILPIPRITQSRTVRQELERNNVDETLKTIDSSGDTDDLVGRVGNRVVIVIADDDRSTFSSGDLGKSRSDLGVERVSGHDEDDAENEHGQANLAYYLRKVLVHKRKGPVLELSSEDSLAVHVGNLLDLQGTLKTSSI
jgi:hypothetical protein